MNKGRRQLWPNRHIDKTTNSKQEHGTELHKQVEQGRNVGTERPACTVWAELVVKASAFPFF